MRALFKKYVGYTMDQKHGSRLVKSQLVVNAIERIFNEPSSAIEEVNYGSGYRTPQTAPA